MKKNIRYEKPILERLDKIGKGQVIGKCDPTGSGAIGRCTAGAGVVNP